MSSHSLSRVPQISVAMSVCNDARYLGAAIESILAQSFTDFEFLIVDDGSTDGSSAIIADHAARDRRIRAIHQENRGLIASLNRLLAEAQAPLFARMDGDDIAMPERFARQVAFLAAHPACGVLGGQAENIDAGGRSLGPSWPRPTGADAVRAALQHYSPLIHPAVMARTAVLRALGGYRPAYLYCEDYDLWLRAAELTRLDNLPEPLVRYRRSPDQISNRHLVAQNYGVLVARAAALARAAGLGDPTRDMAALPPLADLDAAFGQEGVTAWVRERLARGLVYSAEALRGEGFAILIDHVAAGGARDGMWRTAAWLARIGEWRRAARLGYALLR